MVRFIIILGDMGGTGIGVFTFQYGQIYYIVIYFAKMNYYDIYIPIWLDLLSKSCFFILFLILHLHSNMVRFIIRRTSKKSKRGIRHLHSNMVRFIIKSQNFTLQFEKLFTFQYGQIYYLCLLMFFRCLPIYLHSNMVRFIITSLYSYIIPTSVFTFQYGQIYYFFIICNMSCIIIIYIPIWLDLL